MNTNGFFLSHDDSLIGGHIAEFPLWVNDRKASHTL